MHRFTEGEIRVGVGLGTAILLVGWVLLLTQGIDEIPVLLLLVSWHLARRDASRSATVLSGMLLVAGISSGLSVWPWGCLAGAGLVCAGFLLPRPSNTGSLEKSVLISLVLLGLMTVISGLSGRPSERLVTPVILMTGWWMVLRFAALEEGRRLLRRTGIPVWLAVLVWLYVVLAGDSGFVAQRRADTLLKKAAASETHDEALELLTTAGSIFPWSPSVWAELGALHLAHSDVKEAFGSFMRGYEIRPGRNNPCVWGVVETARTLGKAHILARLIDHKDITAAFAGASGRIDVAVELWRRGDPETALDIIEPTAGSTRREREIAGWLAEDIGQDAMAIEIMEPIVAAGEASGETVYRLIKAYERQGLSEQAHRISSKWNARFPKHLGIQDSAGLPVHEPCEDYLGGDGILLGNAVRLLGWDVFPKPVAVGETLRVRTYWAATKPLRDMVLILHLDVGSPPTWRLNRDHAPLSGLLPTSKWPVGELVTDSVEVFIPGEAPVGTYRVFTGLWTPGDEETRLYPAATHADLIPRGEKRIPLGTIEVIRE